MKHGLMEDGRAPTIWISSPISRFFNISTHHRALIVWGDDSVSLLQQRLSVWTREEALGAVVDSIFVELPATPKTAPHAELTDSSSSSNSIMDFINMQILAAKVGRKDV